MKNPEALYQVLYEGADESIADEGDIYELYDTLHQLIEERYGQQQTDFHFQQPTSTSNQLVQ